MCCRSLRKYGRKCKRVKTKIKMHLRQTNSSFRVFLRSTEVDFTYKKLSTPPEKSRSAPSLLRLFSRQPNWHSSTLTSLSKWHLEQASFSATVSSNKPLSILTWRREPLLLLIVPILESAVTKTSITLQASSSCLAFIMELTWTAESPKLNFRLNLNKPAIQRQNLRFKLAFWSQFWLNKLFLQIWSQ